MLAPSEILGSSDPRILSGNWEFHYRDDPIPVGYREMLGHGVRIPHGIIIIEPDPEPIAMGDRVVPANPLRREPKAPLP